MSHVVHIEICQKPSSTEKSDKLATHCLNFVRSHQNKLYGDVCFNENDFQEEFLKENVLNIKIQDVDDAERVDVSQIQLIPHVYQLFHEEPGNEEIEQGNETIVTASHWLMPSPQFDGIWENLIFDQSIKANLLNYAKTTLIFSDAGVDPNVITWNKVVLLHGPPGTGKTSLCQALAQKLCIHLSHRYSYGQLLEINSHSLFSKWFSESGKLVQKMFEKIQELIDDPQALVFVLIDEVESLTAARQSMAGSEPSDAVRVVNALLTQLDNIKKYPNVMILTTSNVSGNVDLAFVDRADIKQYIGPPSVAAVYTIFHSCLNELSRVGLICGNYQIMKIRAVEALQTVKYDASRDSVYLHKIALQCEGLSGRTLRKLPFLAHAMAGFKAAVKLEEFLPALEQAVQKQIEDRVYLDQNHLKSTHQKPEADNKMSDMSI